MTDVRLTATNPEDSSVVPVACNSRGELLVTEPVIEQIDNDVSINGNVEISIGNSETNRVDFRFQNDLTSFGAWNIQSGFYAHDFRKGGHAIHRRVYETDSFREVELTNNSLAIAVRNGDTTTWKVDWAGRVNGTSVLITLEPDNPAHYRFVRDAETGEESKEYVGPVINVRDELEFLRTQVRALMEKLKMTPEGGWEVWDGSTET